MDGEKGELTFLHTSSPLLSLFILVEHQWVVAGRRDEPTESVDKDPGMTDDQTPLFVVQLCVSSHLDHLPQQSYLTTGRKEIERCTVRNLYTFNDLCAATQNGIKIVVSQYSLFTHSTEADIPVKPVL